MVQDVLYYQIVKGKHKDSLCQSDSFLQ